MKSILSLFTLFLTLCVAGCGSKKEGNGTDDPDKKNGTTEKRVTPEKAPKLAASLSELVYEGIGSSASKSEKIARSKSELKARVNLIEVLAEDLEALTLEFTAAHAELFPDDLDAEAFAAKARSVLSGESSADGKTVKKVEASLSGSRISEYGSSGDTTYAYAEISLNDAYAVMERGILDAAREAGYVAAGKEGSFKEKFKAFFMAEKQKLVDEEQPS